MSVAISIRRGDAATGDVKAKSEVLAVQVTGADPSKLYYILADAPAGSDDLKSQVFGPSHDGLFEWDSLILLAAGAWTMRLRDSSNDSDAATVAVTAG